MKNKSETIRGFWNWFSSVSNSFGERFENQKVVEELDRRIALLGDIGWEIGPGVLDSSNSTLVFSPCGNADLLPLTKAIVDAAPVCEGWEFLHSKPPKQWQLEFDLLDNSGQDLRVNANEWRYVLLRRADGKFDLVICAPDLMNLDSELRSTAAEIAVDGQLGESKRLTLISSIDVVGDFELQWHGKDTGFIFLADHMNKLLSD